MDLLLATPEHPAPPFLEALIIYWEHFPLRPDDPVSERFVYLMDQSVEMAAELIKNQDTYLEGIFFDLFGRAFKAMFWADNGKSGKVVSDLGPMYRQVKEGMELKDEFVEFYFSTGLYNYYIEAYPEAHPVYKPLIAFMQNGDRQHGLVQLNYAIDHTVFLKVEAMLFMSIIQLQYEQDLKTAALYAGRLHSDYPRNTYYQGHLITILLHLNRFGTVQEVLSSMKDQEDRWTELVRTLAESYMAEKQWNNDVQAGRGYQKLLDLADSFGPIADAYSAMAYMGLSRIYEKMGDESEARKFSRKASKHTSYPFILGE
jgi:tetratricopeptide (TPR) repeat protein